MEETTYKVYEENGEKLHVIIYRESENNSEPLAICYDIKPEDLKNRLENLKDYPKWKGIILRNNNEGRDIFEESWNIRKQDNTILIDETEVYSASGFARLTWYSSMNSAGRKAYNLD